MKILCTWLRHSDDKLFTAYDLNIFASRQALRRVITTVPSNEIVLQRFSQFQATSPEEVLQEINSYPTHDPS